ncbi:MAG TPA: class I SAM-dependent rRNA methyltransferase [Syntrophorhabdaceae bacterium]|nr:class I SAM-dependent rRNA methyltransferase [Syntrophorhabdaceae bacterium]
MEAYKTLVVKNNKTGPIINFHPWVFSKAILKIPEGLIPGEPVRLYDENKRFLGLGYFNSYSLITVRIWGYNETETVDVDFFKKRVRHAYEIRKRFVETQDTNAFRIINGENDLLPGLIVDKYDEYLVVQIHTKGMDKWKNEIIQSLIEVIRPKGIYERSDVQTRELEGLKFSNKLLFGDIPDLIQIKERGIKFLVDIKHGQKTGFFMDQRDKRYAFMKYTKDKSVLNCFSYTGGFSIYALAGGAERVINVDTSEDALELARENVLINGFDPNKCSFLKMDVKDYLKENKEQFDAIVLDPPAFIKDRKKINEGKIGYKTINELALKSLKEDGILLTCSCSAHLKMEDFRYLLVEAAGKAQKHLKILETFTHGIDHLQGISFLEGSYLKCIIATI